MPLDLASKIPSGISEWIVKDKSYNKAGISSFALSHHMNCKRIVIGKQCLQSVRSFVIYGLNALEMFEVGCDSVVNGDDENDDGSCRIVNCPKLKSIKMGDYAFANYSSLELSNLPALESIEMKRASFLWLKSFSLSS